MFHYPFNHLSDLFQMRVRGDLKKFLDISMKNAEIVKKNGKRYYNVPCSFDIETSSVYYENGVQTSKRNDDLQQEKFACMYIWQFGLNGYVIIGRTWGEFLELCLVVSSQLELSEDDLILECYVHSLEYEFQFMRKWLQFKNGNVFSVDVRKPVKALCSYGIQFMDSYILSALSLDMTGKQLMKYKCKKLVGNLDYDKVRNSLTILTKEETDYCINDVLVVMCYIQEQIEQYGNITKIPLTNTSRVRIYARNMCFYGSPEPCKNSEHKKKYVRFIHGLTINSVEEYNYIHSAFMGGFTHANIYHVKDKKPLKNVASFDLTSSYPARFFNYFPMGNGKRIEIESKEQFKEMLETYHCIFAVRFTNLTPKFEYENILSQSKCLELSGEIMNNGRVMTADSATTILTEIDYWCMEKFYTWDEAEVGTMFIYQKGFLPTDLLESVLHLYESKTRLKGVEDDESKILYMRSKQMLNSLYGMMVTSIIHDDNAYSGTEWLPESQKDVMKLIEKYNNDKTRFTSYLWGIYITAYARENLFDAILHCGADYLYSDTDSVKVLHPNKHFEYFKRYNDGLYNRMKMFCELNGLDFDKCNAKDIHGNTHLIGAWTYEGTYKRFKTLGAKRYMYETQDGRLHLVVAGLSPRHGVEYVERMYRHDKNTTKCFDAFDDSLYIPSTETGKMTHTYCDDEIERVITDYNGTPSSQLEKSFIHLSKCEYSLSMGAQFIDILLSVKEDYKL